MLKHLDEIIVLQALDAGTNWAVVTNKCYCRSIGVSAQPNAMYEVTAVKIYLAKSVLCITFVIGNINLISVTNVHITDFT